MFQHCLCIASALALSAAGIQAPRAPWRTLTTRHYRIHYPPVMAGWAQDVASRIEGIHGRVVALVGYESPVPIQVVLVDPMADPNGMAMPLLDSPYVTLWRTEPRSDDLHGNALSTWTEELVSHELTHIHHLTRPRGPRGVLENLFGLPIGPLALKCPRWVTEGFATLAEGRITGSGRPHSALRAALVRQWAREGKLPEYGDLDGSPDFLGGNTAYMVGSAYLEWLERQRPAGDDPLRRLWKHLASRRGRSFDAAFTAAFGFPPRDGYQRFRAETAHDALEFETALKAQGLREGEPFLRIEGALRDLAVSPDGTRLLASLEALHGSGLRVWNLKDAPVKAKARRPDPFNDAPEIPGEMPVREAAATLPALDHRIPHRAEWVDDHTIRFQIKEGDAEGTLHRRPALWRLPGGVERSPRTVPPARWTTLEPVHRQGVWILELEGQRVPLPGQAVGRAFLEPQRSLLWAACEVEGVWNIVKVPFRREGGEIRFQEPLFLTRTLSAAWNPAPSPDGRTLYFTTLDPKGVEVRRLDLALPPLGKAPAPEPRLLTPASILPPPVEAVDLPRAAPPFQDTPYRAAENLWNQPSSGLSLTPSGESWQVGVGGSDLLGRLSWQVLAGFGNGAGPRGAMAGFSSSAWAWKPSLTVFSALERPSRQRWLPVEADRERRGFEATLTYEDRGDTPFWFSPVVAAERLEFPQGPLLTRSLVGLRAGMSALWARGPWGLVASPQIQWFPGSTSGAGRKTWNLTRAELALKLETPFLPLTLRTSGGRLTPSGGGTEAFHLGGVTSSLVPESLDCDRVEQAALPAHLATGDRFLRWRGELGGILQVYAEGTALWRAGEDRPPYLRVAGLRLALDNPLGLASEDVLRRLRLELGVHRILDGVLKNRATATLTLVVRP